MRISNAKADTHSTNDGKESIQEERLCHLDDCMKKAHPKDDLPPVAAESVLFKEVRGDLCEGSSYVGSQSFRRFIGHLAAHTKQRLTRLCGCF